MKIYLSQTLPEPNRLTHWTMSYVVGETVYMDVDAWFGEENKGKYIKIQDVPSGYYFTLTNKVGSSSGWRYNSFDFMCCHRLTTTGWLSFEDLHSLPVGRYKSGLKKTKQDISSSIGTSINAVSFWWDNNYREIQ